MALYVSTLPTELYQGNSAGRCNHYTRQRQTSNHCAIAQPTQYVIVWFPYFPLVYTLVHTFYVTPSCTTFRLVICNLVSLFLISPVCMWLSKQQASKKQGNSWMVFARESVDGAWKWGEYVNTNTWVLINPRRAHAQRGLR